MSIDVIEQVLKGSRTTGNERSVLLVLAYHAHADGTHAFPCHALIASEANIAERTVRDCLARIKALGEIEPEGKVGRTISYRITLAGKAAGSRRNPEDGKRRIHVEKAADSDNIPADSRRESGGPPPTNRKEPSEPLTEPSPQTPQGVYVLPAKVSSNRKRDKGKYDEQLRELAARIQVDHFPHLPARQVEGALEWAVRRSGAGREVSLDALKQELGRLDPPPRRSEELVHDPIAVVGSGVTPADRGRG